MAIYPDAVDRDPTAINQIETAKQVEKRTLSAARRAAKSD
jgi:hypothetical protein